MASLVLPGQAVPTLAVTMAASAITAARRALKNRNKPSVATSPSITLSPTDPVTLDWNNVTCTLTSKQSSRKLLDAVSGSAKPGRVLAIMGPSGSGKTTLLNSLAGRLPASPKIDLRGSVTINDIPLNQAVAKLPIAYVTQEDLFFSQLTVEETLQTAAALRLTTNAEERRKVVDRVIRTLSLVTATDTRVGDAKNRGISGGEKKRLSLACELISTPKLILCDEPTTGLDTFQAENVMSTLQSLARSGHTVICSIHQPSGSVFSMCDDLALLASGQMVYFGPTTDAPSFFNSAGFPVPSNVNPAEHYLKLISVDYSDDETTVNTRGRIDGIVQAFDSWRSSEVTDEDNDNAQNAESADKIESAVAVRATNRPNIFSQIRVLFVRALRQIVRDKKTNISRLTSSLASALLFGAIYWRIGYGQRTIQDRMGLLQVCTINSAMTALVKTLNVFPKESVLVNRERVRGSYSVFEYFVSKLIAEMPVSAFFPLVFSTVLYPMVRLSGGARRVGKFLGVVTLESFTAASYGLAIGALIPSTEAALAIGPASFVLQIVFGGLYITDKSVPNWASWIPRISLVKHAFEALCVNEFRGLEFESRRPWDVKEGQQVLQRMTWGDSTVAKACISQARVLSFNYLLTYAILQMKKPRFAKMKPIDDNAEPETVEA